jgi:nitrogen fixation/metabolism regulation signal transduction histidine kinase
VHSARLITQPDPGSKLERVYSTIEERAQHLQGFVEGYARFARLPPPRREHVEVSEFLRHIEALVHHVHVVSFPAATGYFDRQQLEQVVINLLKNAEEAGGPRDAIALSMEVASSGATTIRVTDAGLGMSPQVLQNAMLPFYSTKERGSGLGLALCREIIEAHGGSIHLENRETGGLSVTCVLPGSERTQAPASAKLTLSRL